MNKTNQPQWVPSAQRVENSNIAAFMRQAGERWGREFVDYSDLHLWSVSQPEQFWASVWSFCGVIASERGDIVVENIEKMPGASWFPQARLNFSENLLRRRDKKDALVFRGEDKVVARVTYKELYDQVSQLSQALRELDIRKGDCVAAFVPNMPETMMCALAVASIGAIWSSCSPDFGVQGVVDRFGQVEPKLLITADGYFYNGKTHDSLGKVSQIVDALPSVKNILVIPYTQSSPSLKQLPNTRSLGDAMSAYSPQEIEFEQLPFDHPLYILYSSGTTGVPKCIVHSAGGALLKHLQEQRIHCDLKPNDKLFYFTTCGWMMWNWLITGLASEATLLLYDGSPFYPDGNVLFDYADAQGITIFGTSAKYIDALNKAGLEPKGTHKLDSLQTILSTGSPLAPEGFDYVYQNMKSDLCLSSMSGGTDICGCFIGGNPAAPVWRGEIQCAHLGMKIDVLDDDGNELPVGEKGDLVCSVPFPSMPVGFWNDENDHKYHAAYFERFPNVWCHGDYIEHTEHGGYIIHGRSDATLNPGGVRIGTAEIYRQAEKIDEVVESLVIGQQWDGDTRVVLFVRLRDGVELDEQLRDRIKQQIRTNTTPRHVPAKVVQVTDIPRTKSGKIVELAVRNVVHGEPVKNKEALANPEALDLFVNRAELQD